METKNENIKKARCPQCQGERNCDQYGVCNSSGGDDHYTWWANWYLLQCRGCEKVFIQKVMANSEDYDPYHNNKGEVEYEYHETIEYWPALSKRNYPYWQNEISSISALGEQLDAAFEELYGALNNDLYMLAGIGIRTCFDIAASLLGIDPSITFKEKLTELVDNGYIGIVDRSHLEVLIDAGNASAHRGWIPDSNELSALMDVLENFIEEAFIKPAKRKRLDANIKQIKVPARKPKKSTKP